MMKREQRKKYLELEKQMEHKYRKVRENEVVLTEHDFKDGKLKPASFTRLKDESWYIPYEERIEIKLPESQKENFKESLELYSMREIYKVKADRREARIHAIILFFAGLAILAVGAVINIWVEVPVLSELVMIIAWVFVWAATDKWFFDRRDLREQRFTLLQLMSAKIIYVQDDTSSQNACLDK